MLEGGVIPGKPITVSSRSSHGVGMPNIARRRGRQDRRQHERLGTFSVPDVTPLPYGDVSFALKTNDSQPRVTVYKGLTRPDPTLIALGATADFVPADPGHVPVGHHHRRERPGLGAGPGGRVRGPEPGHRLRGRRHGDGRIHDEGTDGPLWFGATSITGTLHAGLVLDNGEPGDRVLRQAPNVNVSGGRRSRTRRSRWSDPRGVINAKVTAPARYTDAKMITARGHPLRGGRRDTSSAARTCRSRST